MVKNTTPKTVRSVRISRYPTGAYTIISDGRKKQAAAIVFPHLFTGNLDTFLQKHIGCCAKDAYSQSEEGSGGIRYSFSSESAMLNHEIGSLTAV